MREVQGSEKVGHRFRTKQMYILLSKNTTLTAESIFVFLDLVLHWVVFFLVYNM